MKRAGFIIFFLFFVSACSLLGVHFKLHNPKRAGKYPQKTEALNLLGDQESKYRTCFDVTYYDIDVVFGKDLKKDKSITGRVSMRASVVEKLDTIQLDANEQLTIKSVQGSWIAKEGLDAVKSSIDLKWYRKEGALFVIFPKEIGTDYDISVHIEYSGTPSTAKRPPWKGGFVEKEDDLDNPWWGVACQSEGASFWWPCKDVVNDEPERCGMHFTVPKGLVAVSNGMPEAFGYGHAPSKDPDMEVFNWYVSYPINLYNITFYIGKFKLLHDTYVSKVTGDTLQLNHYVLEQHYDQAKEHFKQLKNHLAVYEQLFGPYPFYRDGFKLVESPYAGMEHQTAIAYGNKFKNNYLGFDYIILHETAHEWWGNSLTAYDLAEGWLHEGFATYAECLYVEKTKGYQAYLDYLRNYKWAIINRRSMVGPYGLRYFNYKDGDIYTKGAWTLHTLRYTINNDSVFFDIIKTFATRYAYKNVTTKDFISVINEKTGSDYTWFFDQYAYNRFVPELEYCTEGSLIYYRWNPRYTKQSFPLPIAAESVDYKSRDTIRPHTYVDTMRSPGGQSFYWYTGILVKFTENKKLKREFRKQPAGSRTD